MRLPAASSLLSRVRIFDRVLTAQSSAALAGEDEGTYYRTPSSYDAVELHMEACVCPPHIRRLPCVASPPGAPLQVGIRLVLVLAVLRAAKQPVRVAQLKSRLLQWLAKASRAVAEHRTVLRVAVQAEHLELGSGCGRWLPMR